MNLFIFGVPLVEHLVYRERDFNLFFNSFFHDQL